MIVGKMKQTTSPFGLRSRGSDELKPTGSIAQQPVDYGSHRFLLEFRAMTNQLFGGRCFDFGQFGIGNEFSLEGCQVEVWCSPEKMHQMYEITRFSRLVTGHNYQLP